VGFINGNHFIPARLNFGSVRARHTFTAMCETLQLPEILKIITEYEPGDISTITVLRETLSCRLGDALFEIGVKEHFGDAFIGAHHIKSNEGIKTAYSYENIEGLKDGGLWVIADSICMGRNLLATLHALLTKMSPKEIILVAPIASKIGIEAVGMLVQKHTVPITFVAWDALFGVDAKTKYDMPWGHPDTVPIDSRDQELFRQIYGPNLCMGGDFGNNYYCPSRALTLYEAQLKEHKIVPKIPTVKDVLKIFAPDELVSI
jgi:hypothetical protein